MCSNLVSHAETFAQLGVELAKTSPQARAEFFEAFTMEFVRRHKGFEGNGLRVVMQLVECASIFEHMAQVQSSDKKPRQME